MKKTIVCIFAHPDDEAFGPSGTIAKWSKENDVYILCATKGEAGQDNDTTQSTPLQERRAQEMIESAKILGVKEVIYLGFTDGTLSNNLYHKLAEEITKHLEILKPETIMTYEPRGISGHIDHITVSMVSTFVFKKLDFIKTLYYFCISAEQRSLQGEEYFIYFPPGYTKDQINEVITIEEVWEQKLAAISKHVSQISDINRILSRLVKLPKEENFIILQK